MNIFSDSDFRKSSLSHLNPWSKKTCVEIAIKEDAVGVRDSKDPQKNTLCFTHEEWAAFIGGVKKGEFDINP